MIAADPPRVLVADPPWRFSDSLPGAGIRGAAKHYPVLSTDDIERFPLPQLAADAVLFLWRVAAMPEEALRVCRAWGFVPKTELVWLKRTKTNNRHFGMGRIVRGEHETCLIGVRGRPSPLTRSIRSTFEAPVGRHSAKPDEFYALVERLFDGPYVELFARRRREGWDCRGNELSPGPGRRRRARQRATER
jgi:N6-adenosine-specific RNA methylase IME4